VPEPLDFDPIAEAARQWTVRFDGAPVPAMAAVTSIMRSQQILLARLNALLDPHALSFARYEALMLLFFSSRGSLPLGKMGARLQVHRTAVTNLVDGLEKAGLVTRARHPTDRRTTLATITAHGRETARNATEALHAARFGLDPLADPELDELTTVLRRLRIAEGDFTE
jgi:DNA-binding MarR family transcriptional regulator